WIYVSESKLTDYQQDIILNKISEYLKTWDYHNNPLTSSVIIKENHFIIIALDDSEFGVGGCSIDSLQRIIQELEKNLNISLLNRLNVFCNINQKVVCIPSFKLGSIANKDTLYYDLTILKKNQISTFLKPIKDGWCASYL
ncbi:MAG TPA: hypothetical protein QF851_05230, partial [Flavobacteriales bacterium]|nr:hypothetical protein [Flavobacteriales bacterium]